LDAVRFEEENEKERRIDDLIRLAHEISERWTPPND
jgi:hypothetical protein